MRILTSTLGKTIECGCGQSHQLTSRRLFVGNGELNELPRMLADLAFTGRGLIVGDENTLDAAGPQIGQLLAGAGRSCERLSLTPAAGFRSVRCDAGTLRKVQTCLKGGFQWAIALGAGSISDLVKIAADRAKIPYVAVVTAPSNASFLSSEAILFGKQFPQRLEKLTPAAGAIADISIFAGAPPELIRAGVGDALACTVTPVEWQLNRLLAAEPHCDRAARMIRVELKKFLEEAAAPRLDSEKFLTALTLTLFASGCAMQMLETPIPAAGGEHAIGLAIETLAHLDGRDPAPHGLTVAVGCWQLFELYCRFFPARARYATASPDPERLSGLLEGWKQRNIDATSMREAKAARLEQAETNLSELFAPAFRRTAGQLLGQHAAIRKIYRRFNLPKHPTDLGIPAADADFLLRHAPLLSGRLSLFDLAPGMIKII